MNRNGLHRPCNPHSADHRVMTHPVDALKDFWGSAMDADIEARLRAICDEPVTAPMTMPKVAYLSLQYDATDFPDNSNTEVTK